MSMMLYIQIIRHMNQNGWGRQQERVVLGELGGIPIESKSK